MTNIPPPPPEGPFPILPALKRARVIPLYRQLQTKLEEAWGKRGVWNQDEKAYEYIAKFRPKMMPISPTTVVLRPPQKVLVPWDCKLHVEVEVVSRQTFAMLRKSNTPNQAPVKCIVEMPESFTFRPPVRINFETFPFQRQQVKDMKPQDVNGKSKSIFEGVNTLNGHDKKSIQRKSRFYDLSIQQDMEDDFVQFKARVQASKPVFRKSKRWPGLDYRKKPVLGVDEWKLPVRLNRPIVEEDLETQSGNGQPAEDFETGPIGMVPWSARSKRLAHVTLTEAVRGTAKKWTKVRQTTIPTFKSR